MKIKVINTSPNVLPSYAKSGDSGMDLRADFSRGVNEDFMWGCAFDEKRQVLVMFSGGRCLVPTGLFTSFPPGYEIQVRSRSGLALKNGIQVLNSPGTIDSGFRNEWGVILFNTSDDVFEIAQGDRIAQAVLTKVSLIEWDSVEILDESERNTTGFGDSGRK